MALFDLSRGRSMKRLCLALFLVIIAGVPAKAWYSKGYLPTCNSWRVIVPIQQKFSYANRKTFHWGVGINSVTEIRQLPDIIQDRSLIGRRYCRGTAAVRRASFRGGLSDRIQARLRLDRLAGGIVPACLRSVARLWQLVPLDPAVRRVSSSQGFSRSSLFQLGSGPGRPNSTSTSSPSPGRPATAPTPIARIPPNAA